MTFTLNSLPYNVGALSPFMSAETLEYHYGKHHQAYVTNLNNLLQNSSLLGKSLEEIITATYNDTANAGIFNNAAQHYNHIEFWNSMKNNPNAKIPEKVNNAIVASFGDFNKFKEDFLAAGMQVFGSGWLWLAKNNAGNLEIVKTANGVNPVALGMQTVLGVDVWEHSYYIDYRNKRADYLKAWFENLINWEYVESKV